jgi:ATP-dependent DNA helicase RecQ
MNKIAFFDFEVKENTNEVGDIGCVREDGAEFHKRSISEFLDFIGRCPYICGHNIINHDLKYIQADLQSRHLEHVKIIDTLFLSPLLFPSRPYHNLVKDDKLQSDDLNNPLNDSIKAKDLFFDEVCAFNIKEERLKAIFYLLLRNCNEFASFFEYISYSSVEENLVGLIKEHFRDEICEQADIASFVLNYPMPLAYCLALVDARNRYSITPRWVNKCFPEVEQIMKALRNNPCLKGCNYCNQALNIQKGLKRHFGFDSFRTFIGKPLQEEAVKAAVDPFR